jgi:hypothetical protein
MGRGDYSPPRSRGYMVGLLCTGAPSLAFDDVFLHMRWRGLPPIPQPYAPKPIAFTP